MKAEIKRQGDEEQDQNSFDAAKNLGVQRAESEIIPELNAAPSFTPGPWKVEHNTRLEIISSVEPYEGCGWGQAVAHVYRAGKMNGTPYRMPAEANARLIAAAPALYAALQQVLNVMEIQEQREAEAFHLSALAFRPMWDKAGLTGYNALALANDQVTSDESGSEK